MHYWFSVPRYHLVPPPEAKIPSRVRPGEEGDGGTREDCDTIKRTERPFRALVPGGGRVAAGEGELDACKQTQI